MAGCAAGAIAAATLASAGGRAGAASSSTVLHYFQREMATTFYSPSNHVIHGYPPLGGHVREDDVDYVGNSAHHAKAWTVSDHLYCTVVASPATADCFTQFAVGGSIIYADNFSINLASGAGLVPVSGGTGRFTGDTGSIKVANIGDTSNAIVVISLHKK